MPDLQLSVVQEPGEKSDQKGSGFAGSGLGLAGHILAGQADGQGVLLNGGAAAETCFGNALHERFRQVKFIKLHVMNSS